MSKWVVDEQLLYDQEHKVRTEADPIGESTGDEPRRDNREHHLINEEENNGDAAGARPSICDRDAAEERPI